VRHGSAVCGLGLMARDLELVPNPQLAALMVLKGYDSATWVKGVGGRGFHLEGLRVKVSCEALAVRDGG